MPTRDDRPGWIVNLTNDGWFGISTGPYQHLQQARLRAIEEGLPVVRAANTGISAVIDPLGRIVARLGLGLEGVLDSSLPSAIPPTLYARTGDIPAAIFVAAALIFVIRRRTAKRAPELCRIHVWFWMRRETPAEQPRQLTDRLCIRILAIVMANRFGQFIAKLSAFLIDLPSRI